MSEIHLELSGDETGVLLAALRAIIEDGVASEALEDPELTAAIELDRKISVALDIEPLDVENNAH